MFNTSVPLPTLVVAVCVMLPAPSAVRVVVPAIFVSAITMLPSEPADVERVSEPPVINPPAVSVPPAAVLSTISVPVPTFEGFTVRAALLAVMEMMPDVALAFIKSASVLEIVALPVPMATVSVPVLRLVAAVCVIVPDPSAVSVTVPFTIVSPTLMLPLDPAAVVRFKLLAVTVPDVLSVPPEALSVMLSVPLVTFEVPRFVEAVSVTVTLPLGDVAFILAAAVLEIVASPFAVIRDSVPVPTLVPPV